MKLPKAESARRYKASVEWFMKNPTASEDRARAAWRAGEVTGKREPVLRNALLYQSRQEARLKLGGQDRSYVVTPEGLEIPASADGSLTLTNAIIAAWARLGPLLPDDDTEVVIRKRTAFARRITK